MLVCIIGCAVLLLVTGWTQEHLYDDTSSSWQGMAGQAIIK